MTSKLIYYVYAYIRSKDSTTAKAGTPYYIGKGNGRRAWNIHGRVKVPKDKSKIVLLESGLSDVGACAIERRLITWWGRKDLNNGILLNLSEGGDGSAGYRQTESAKSKISATHKGKKKSTEHRLNMSLAQRGKRKSVQYCENHKQYYKDNPVSKEHLERMTEAAREYHTGRKQTSEHIAKRRKKNIITINDICFECIRDAMKYFRVSRQEIEKHIGSTLPSYKYICPHCGHSSNYGSFMRDHFDKCKLNDKNNPI